MIEYSLMGAVGYPLPNLKGSMALYRASQTDLRVLVCVAQLSPEEDIGSIALYCECTVEEVAASLEFWKKYGVLGKGQDVAVRENSTAVGNAHGCTVIMPRCRDGDR